MKNNCIIIISCLIIYCLLTGCGDQQPTLDVENVAINYLLFGEFNDNCINDNCYRIFKIKDNQLFFDDQSSQVNIDGNAYKGNFLMFESTLPVSTNGLISQFPRPLLNEIDFIIGQPDFGKEGAIYIEVETKGEIRYWLIDNNTNRIPYYLREWMEELKDLLDAILYE